MNAALLTHLFQEDLYYFTSPVVVVLPRHLDSYSAEEQILLQKILMSVKLDLSAVRMIVQPAVDLASLQIHLPARVLIFGSQTNGETDFYKATTAQGFTLVRADDLGLLDDLKKKNLWTALRQMFGI